jgi:hypothetical protein
MLNADTGDTVVYMRTKNKEFVVYCWTNYVYTATNEGALRHLKKVYSKSMVPSAYRKSSLQFAHTKILLTERC